MQLEVQSSIGKEFAMLARRRRVPLLERCASRIQSNNGLVVEGWIWILKRRKLEAPYEIERIRVLVPLDSCRSLEILSGQDDCINGPLPPLNTNRAMHS
jgi:hypothetical protein